MDRLPAHACLLNGPPPFSPWLLTGRSPFRNHSGTVRQTRSPALVSSTGGSSGHACGNHFLPQSHRRLYRGGLSSERPHASRQSRQADAAAARLFRPDRHSADARRAGCLSGGCLAGCVRKSGRPASGRPAARRSLEPLLAGCAAVRRSGRTGRFRHAGLERHLSLARLGDSAL